MEVLKMENSVLFFDDACRETYRLLKEEGLIKKENKEEKYITIEEICKAIKDCRHNTEFYFQCGVAAHLQRQTRARVTGSRATGTVQYGKARTI